MVGKRQPRQAGGNKGRLEAARIARVLSVWLAGQARRVIKNGRQEATGTGRGPQGQVRGSQDI